MEEHAREPDGGRETPAPADRPDEAETGSPDAGALDAGDPGAVPNPEEWQPEEAARFLATLFSIYRQLNPTDAGTAPDGAPLAGGAPPEDAPSGADPAAAHGSPEPETPPPPQPIPIPTGAGRHPAIDPERLSPELKIRVGLREQASRL
jgi:hypothetical protein